MVGVLLHQVAQTETVGKFLGVILQVQDDLRAALVQVHILNGELAITRRLPMNALFHRCTGAAGKHFHGIGHDE